MTRVEVINACQSKRPFRPINTKQERELQALCPVSETELEAAMLEMAGSASPNFGYLAWNLRTAREKRTYQASTEPRGQGRQTYKPPPDEPNHDWRGGLDTVRAIQRELAEKLGT